MIENIIQQGEIQFNPDTHEYFHVPTRRKLLSVSAVIATVYSTKSWDGVDPAIVENARIRGSLVDRYMSTYIRDGQVVIEGESADVTDRIKVAHYWYEA